MALWNVGSIANQVWALVDNIPSSVSGTPLNNIIEQRIAFVEKYLGVTIGTTNIDVIYQGPITELTQAKLLTVIETQGTDANSISLGEFSIRKGQGSAALESAQRFEANAMKDLCELKAKFISFKALG
jgi:hypothetical protein